uniref:Uncharacterized protein n=1 Tax=Trichogramma kaykai TaxID=54128 RepID=A0ABD2W922_9HYME
MVHQGGPTDNASSGITDFTKSKQKNSRTLARVFLSPPIVSAQEGKLTAAPIQRKRRRIVLLRRGHPLVSDALKQLCVIKAVLADENLVKSRQRAIERVKSVCRNLVSPPGSIYTDSSCKSLHTWPYLPLPVPCPHQWQRTIKPREPNTDPEAEAVLTTAPLPLQPTTSPNLI